jgi:MFS family permease
MVALTDNDAEMSGLLFFALFIPASVCAPLAGVVADAFDRKRIVLVCYAAVAGVVTALAVTTANSTITPNLLLGLSLLLGTAFAFVGPANLAIAANSVPEKDLASAVSMQSAANNLTRVLGPMLAAPLLAGERFDISFAIYLVSVIAAALLIASMRLSPYTPDDDGTGIWSRMASGVAHARDRRPALPALCMVGMLSLFGVAHTVLLPIFAENVLGDRDLFVWMVAATGVGALAGALVAGSDLQPPSLTKSSWRLIAYGVALVLFATTTDLRVALGAQVVIGYFYFAVMTSLQTLLQQVVDESKRGRVMSLFQIAWAGLVPFGGLAMGYVAAPLGVATTLVGAAAVLMVFGLGMGSWSRGDEAARTLLACEGPANSAEGLAG